MKKDNNFHIKPDFYLSLHEYVTEIDPHGGHKPIKEGSQQPPQQHLVSRPRAHMTVH